MSSSAFADAGGATITSTNGTYPVTLEGSQTGGKHRFVVNGAVTECETATFTSGSLSAPTGTLTITPNYGGAGACEMFGIKGATITVNGCDYRLTSVAGGATTAKVTIECPAGQQITFDTPFNVCDLHVKPQGGLGHVTYANAGGHVTLTLNVTGIHAVQTGAFCPVMPGTYTTATYTGSVTLKGAGGKAIDVS